MKESQLKQLIKSVLVQLNENSNPEAWRRHEFPSGEPPEPMDAGEAPDDESLQEKIDSYEHALKQLETKDLKATPGTPESEKLHGQIRQVLNKLIELYAEQERGVHESFGMTHDTVSPQDANTMNKSTIKELSSNYTVTLDHNNTIKLSNLIGYIVVKTEGLVKFLHAEDGPNGDRVKHVLDEIRDLRKQASDVLIQNAKDN